jgi:delta1-piperideine-2-carboxylate reductase
MNTAASDTNILVPYEELVALLQAIFVCHGTSDDVALELARNCAAAERDGAESHGVFRMPTYVSTLRSGYVDGHAVPVVERAAPAFLRVNASNGFAQPALTAGRGQAIDMVRAGGVAVIAIRDSHHFGALWLDTEPFAREGLIAIAYVNGIKRVAPHGGHTPFYGTNPLSMAVPRSGADPLVFDQATSAMAFGELKLAAHEGRDVPPGTGVDRNRKPSTDPAAIADGGAILTFGGYKGSSISMMVELLAGALTGAQFSFEVDRSNYPGAETSKSGELIILLDPALGAGRSYAVRVDDLVKGLRASGQTRIPGERRYARRKETATNGIPIARNIMEGLRAMLVRP